MGGVKKTMMTAALAIASVMILGGDMVKAQTHHVVGGDHGWDPSSNVSSWSDGRIFRVGDKIWFTYSAARGYVAELKSREEYESCNVSNPIRMFTDGLDTISLDGEGIRFFTSSRAENCKSGLKLHVEVLPPQPESVPTIATSKGSAIAAAAGPVIPSASSRTSEMLSSLFFAGLLLCFVGV